MSSTATQITLQSQIIHKDICDRLDEITRELHSTRVGMFEQDGERFYVIFDKKGDLEFESVDAFVSHIFKRDNRASILWVTDNEPVEDMGIEWFESPNGQIYGNDTRRTYWKPE